MHVARSPYTFACTYSVAGLHRPAGCPASARTLPDRDVQHNGWRVVVVAAHGGAGATTVCALLDPERTGWAAESKSLDAGLFGRLPVLVARTSAYGVKAAMRVLALTRIPFRLWLVVVADSPTPPPLSLLVRIGELRPRVAGIASVPYLERLRTVADPYDAAMASSMRRIGSRLRAQLEQSVDDGGRMWPLESS